ncbi:SurA N-terminal domain-containing protein [Alkalicoccus luteus]|uniref:SurA N-terminal domain-containing protein n=1 Tax=Alkalicoccus luteus TaxID=1237094 RepID=A0A969TV86_9BACI|nr:SurA N-terminal domain-containing protein [Alkalicoccus luteus]NJP38155.1 hypothetical protein [Alkalicoccus luteus]
MKKTTRNGMLALSLSTLLFAAACGNENNADNAENNGNTDNNIEESIDNDSENADTPDEDNDMNDAMNGEDDGMNEEAVEDMDPDEAAEFMERDPEEPVAVVNGEEIQSGELQAQLAQFEQIFAEQEMEDEESSMMMMQFQQQFLDQLINQRVMAQEAEEQGLEADEDEVESEYEEIQSAFGSDEEFQEALESQGYTEEELENEIREMNLVEQLLSMDHVEEEYEVDEEEAREAFEMQAMSDPQMAEAEFEDVQEEIEMQIRQNQYVQDLRDQADIEILL